MKIRQLREIAAAPEARLWQASSRPRRRLFRLAIPTICAAWRTICAATSRGSAPRSTPGADDREAASPARRSSSRPLGPHIGEARGASRAAGAAGRRYRSGRPETLARAGVAKSDAAEPTETGASSTRAPLPDHLPAKTIVHEAPCVCPTSAATSPVEEPQGIGPSARTSARCSMRSLLFERACLYGRRRAVERAAARWSRCSIPAKATPRPAG